MRCCIQIYFERKYVTPTKFKKIGPSIAMAITPCEWLKWLIERNRTRLISATASNMLVKSRMTLAHRFPWWPLFSLISGWFVLLDFGDVVGLWDGIFQKCPKNTNFAQFKCITIFKKSFAWYALCDCDVSYLMMWCIVGLRRDAVIVVSQFPVLLSTLRRIGNTIFLYRLTHGHSKFIKSLMFARYD